MRRPSASLCAETNACTAVMNTDTGLYSYFFNGSRWSLSGTLPGGGAPDAQGEGVSCISAEACMAVGVEFPGTGDQALYAANSF